MDIGQEVDRIKKELTNLIVKHLQEKKIEPTVAQQEAADFIALLPIRDQMDLLEKLKELGDKYTEAREVYLEEITKIHEMQRDEVLTQMRNAIKLGDIDHAVKIAKNMKGGK